MLLFIFVVDVSPIVLHLTVLNVALHVIMLFSFIVCIKLNWGTSN